MVGFGDVPAQPHLCCGGQGVRTEEGQHCVLVCEGKAQCKDESLCRQSLLRLFLKPWGWMLDLKVQTNHVSSIIDVLISTFSLLC